MDKKWGFLFVLVFLVLTCILKFSSASSALPSNIGGVEIDSIPRDPDVAVNMSKTYFQTKWDDFLNSPQVRNTNIFFTKLDGLFLFLFNENYGLNSNFFMVIILWFFLFSIFVNLIGMTQINSFIVFLLGFSLDIVIAQIGIIRKISNVSITLIKLPSVWYLDLLALLFFIIFLFFLDSVSRSMYNSSKDYVKEVKIEKSVKKSEKALKEAKEAKSNSKNKSSSNSDSVDEKRLQELRDLKEEFEAIADD